MGPNAPLSAKQARKDDAASRLEAISYSSFSQTEVFNNNVFREQRMVNRSCLRTSYIFHLDAIVLLSPIGHFRWGKNMARQG